MKIGILGVGKVDAEFIERVRERLGSDFANSETELIAEELQLPERAFNEVRGQYDIDVISQRIEDYAEKQARFGRILGIADVGIFVPRLNFVLGVAEHLGKTALVSLWRLKPEFARAFCIMHFANAILETDMKRNLFCSQCSIKAEGAIEKTRANLEGKV